LDGQLHCKDSTPLSSGASSYGHMRSNPAKGVPALERPVDMPYSTVLGHHGNSSHARRSACPGVGRCRLGSRAGAFCRLWARRARSSPGVLRQSGSISSRICAITGARRLVTFAVAGSYDEHRLAAILPGCRRLVTMSPNGQPQNRPAREPRRHRPTPGHALLRAWPRIPWCPERCVRACQPAFQGRARLSLGWTSCVRRGCPTRKEAVESFTV